MIAFEKLSAPTRLFINGDYQDAADGARFDNINPATGQSLGTVARGTAADVDRAVAAARAAFESDAWAGMAAGDRERLLHRLADLIEHNAEALAALETYDTGKPFGDARKVDLPMSVQTLHYYAGWPSKLRGETVPVRGPFLTYTLREPIGVIGQIVPWNFPLFMAVMKLAPALAAGNTVVLKPAEQTPLTALYLGNLLNEAGFPPGVVNIVSGFGGEAGEALINHPDVDKVAFTGSTRTGQHIMRQAAGTLKRVSLELGGKSPHIIFGDADLKSAMRAIGAAIFYNQGEVCIAGSRLFVEKPLYEQALEAASQSAARMKVGDPFAEDTRIGALVSEQHWKRVDEYVKLGVSEGARVVAGGGPAEVAGGGYFYQPTVLAGVRNDMRVAQEEIFGPVLSVIPFEDEADVLALANDTQFGLAAGMWTQNLGRAHRVARAIKAGTVYINAYGIMDPAAPFGGYKMSGLGRENGEEGIAMYTEVKTVWTGLK
ncbi:aldehyde dehydrogenase family protein [Immundisolibacter sp.]|uniref:aldehyde dehydrogenase family protein n=1 Tax=Immundisolibacter sp. TaxID=1934948 RepID=UPI0035662A32